jgi:hypothetical protein
VVAAAEAQPLYLRNQIAFTSAERQLINAARPPHDGIAGSAALRPVRLRAPMVMGDLDEVVALGARVSASLEPRNFSDSLAAGTHWVLREQGELAGYFLLMAAVDGSTC